MDENKKIIKIQIPNTKFWMIAEKVTENLWNSYLLDPQTKQTELIRENISTKAMVLHSNIIFKTSFPYDGKNSGLWEE